MKSFVLSALACCCLLASRPASAESPQHMAMEFRAGVYSPTVDSEFQDVTPFSDIFGSDSAWMIGGEFDVQLLRLGGSLGVFLTTTYGYLEGVGLTESGTQSSDSTTMHLLPFTLGGVYRFDFLATEFGVPLVFAAKLGLEYLIWWIEDGVGDQSYYEDEDGNSSKGMGGTMGVYTSIGLHLLLDFFEPHSAKVFDNDLGVNNSYLFVELAYHWLDDFGSDSSFDLSDGGLYFGLAFEM